MCKFTRHIGYWPRPEIVELEEEFMGELGSERMPAFELPKTMSKVETNYTRVTKQLRDDIIAGVLPLGGRLRMAALAERYGVSVQPVREALQQLEGEGLVQIVPNQGARVSALDKTRLIHAHEIGEALESYLARRFAEEASPKSLRHLEALQIMHDRAVDELDWPGVDEANHQFHMFINTYGGNIEAADVLTRYYWLSLSLMNRAGRSRTFGARVKSEHHALIDAFRQHDPDAAGQISARHVRGTLNRVLEAYDELTSPIAAGPES